MTDALLLNTRNNIDLAGQAAEVKTVEKAAGFEDGASDDFERLLENAERARAEGRKRAREASGEARERASQEEAKVREDLKARRKEGGARAEAYSDYYGDAAEEARDIIVPIQEGLKEAAPNKNPFEFKADRPGGWKLAFAKTQSEISLPGGFKARVSRELLLSGSLESAANGIELDKGKNALSFLKEALGAPDTNLSLFSLEKEALPALEGILSASGADSEKVAELMGSLYAENADLGLKNILLTINKAEASAASAEGGVQGLIATDDGLNNLGQFLLGLGLSLEAVKNVTSGVEPGSLLPASTLRSLVSSAAGGSEALRSLLGEGDLNFLSLALQSMAQGDETINGINLLLEGSQGKVTLSDLLSFLESSEKTQMVASPAKTAEDIQALLSRIKTDQELVKAPVFNEIILKLSLIGDREMDRSFMELSPALQALRGGLGYRGDAASGSGSDPGQGGKEDRKEREERRALASQAALSAGKTPSAASASFAGALGEEAASYGIRETIGKQIRDKLVYSARRGVRKLRMSLSPEALGSVDIELKVKGSTLSANIRAESLEAYKALEKEIGELRRSLSEEGLELKLTLTFEGEGSFHAKDGSEHSLGNGGSGSLSGWGEDPEEEKISTENPEILEAQEDVRFAAVV